MIYIYSKLMKLFTFVPTANFIKVESVRMFSQSIHSVHNKISSPFASLSVSAVFTLIENVLISNFLNFPFPHLLYTKFSL